MTPPPGDAGGQLVLVATPIGNLGDLSPRAADALAGADVVCCEDTRHTGVMLKRLGIAAKRLVSLHAHNETSRLAELIDQLSSGSTIAVVSDAGTPAVSDPGERLVAAAAAAGIRVTTVPGPSAVLAALVVSGMSLRRWRFEGFLPRKGPERRERLAEVASSPCPSICFESPHRLAGTLADLVSACGPSRRVAVCRELTKLHEEVRRSSLEEAAQHYEASSPKGEIVVVVDGKGAAGSDEARPSDGQLASEVQALMAAGSTRRDAVREVTARFGVARSMVYEAAVRSAQPSARPRKRQ